MEWTTKPPKESGYYWAWGLVSSDEDWNEENLPAYEDPLDDVRIVYVTFTAYTDYRNRPIPSVKLTGSENEIDLAKVSAFGWCGPIEHPPIKRKRYIVNG